ARMKSVKVPPASMPRRYWCFMAGSIFGWGSRVRRRGLRAPGPPRGIWQTEKGLCSAQGGGGGEIVGEGRGIGDDDAIVEPRALEADEAVSDILDHLLDRAGIGVAVAAAAGIAVRGALAGLDGLDDVFGDDLRLAAPRHFQPADLGRDQGRAG